MVPGDTNSHHNQQPYRKVDGALACLFGSVGRPQKCRDFLIRATILDVSDKLGNVLWQSCCCAVFVSIGSEDVPLASVIFAIGFMAKLLHSVAIEECSAPRGGALAKEVNEFQHVRVQ